MMRQMVVCASISMHMLSTAYAAERKAPVVPKLGEVAKDAELQPIAGKKLKLSQLTKKGPVTLVVLRGYPGYQCPLCTRQFSELRKHAADFERLESTVVLIYPGEEEGLKERAKEFLTNSTLPKGFVFAIDPDYKFTTLYGLRWDAKNETAYPATFVLDKDRVVKFRKVSKSHGDRAKVEDVLETLTALKVADSTKGREITQD